MARMPSLDLVDLSETSLSGTIPTELGNLNVLDHLDLARVPMLSGSIPSELGMLNVRFLGLSGNGLNGRIPTELGNCERLQILRLQDNELTGTVPSELARLEYLRKWCRCVFFLVGQDVL